jgi:endonuclease G
MDKGHPQNPVGNLRRQTIWMWVAFLALAILIGCFAVLLPRTFNERLSKPIPESTPPPVTTAYWGDRYCYAGTPRPTLAFHDTITILTNTGYLVGYCESRKDPVWAAYRLFRPDSFTAPPRPKAFMPDTRTSSRTHSGDYTGSGYDRGHMAPNFAIAVCYGPSAQQETFLMSNVIPQRPHLNREVWERLEQQEIREYAPRYQQIWVVDGPIFRSHNHLRGGEDIPDACFKIISREEDGRPTVLAFIIPQTVNGGESPMQFLTSIDEVERETGLDFFSAMPADQQQRFETNPVTGMW